MPGAACNALNSFQLVAGCDFHKQIPPPPPAGPLPMAPHVVAYCIGFAIPSTSKASTTVKAGWGFALGRQHDIGMGPYHFAVNALLPIVWAAAGNKAEFGSSTVSIDVNGSGLKMAVALIPVAGLNLQLDCNEPRPMPTSTCVASFNTVMAGFTLADCVAGFASMAMDVAIVWLNNKITGAAMGAANAVITGILSKVGSGITAMVVGGLVASRFPGVTYFLGAATQTLIGWTVGSSLGYSFPGQPWTDSEGSISPSVAPGSTYGGKLNDAVNDLISPPAEAPSP